MQLILSFEGMVTEHREFDARCVVDDIFSAERAKIVNNANVITLGGWITAPFVGTQIVDAWLAMQFTQKMEFKKEFLTNAFKAVVAIEEENLT